MKMFISFTRRHEAHLLPLFKDTLDPSFYLVEHRQPEEGALQYDTPEYYLAIRNKIHALLEFFKKCSENEIVAISDVDIVFNGLDAKTVVHDFLALGVPIAFQRLGFGKNLPCFGFNVMRNCPQVREFWEKVLAGMLQNLDKHDQWIGQDLLDKGIIPYAYLPDQYYSGCMEKALPEDWKLFHFTCLKTVEEKQASMEALVKEKGLLPTKLL
jgi:hypothetical protein